MDKNKIEKVYDQIHAPESLKQKTFEKMKNQKFKKTPNYSFILSVAATVILSFTIGIHYYNNKPVIELQPPKEKQIAFETKNADLNHFKDVKELRDYFDKNYSEKELFYDSAVNAERKSVEELQSETIKSEEAVSDTASSVNHYQTNTQVENVDEADIVKTDGKYIYYVTNNDVYIIRGEDLNKEAKIDFKLEDKSSRYYPNEIFIKDNKLIVIGNYSKHSNKEEMPLNSFKERISTNENINTTKTYIYDISDKANPKELRQVDIEGDYDTARLVGNTLYLVSTKYMYYYPELKDNEIMPLYFDSASSNEYKNIDCKNIVYNDSSKDATYKIIGAVNINDNKEMLVETFLGYGNTIYCSEENLYIASPIYNSESSAVLNSTEIFKFNISSGGLKYICKNTVNGDINNQFSLDEYDGNLRVATTVTIEEKPEKKSNQVVEIGKTTTNNVLYVLDEKLEKIGEITDFGITEKIYSVRFIKDVAYVVTFKQIDPLFVIDLSDPTNPIIKGELEIPGYSSYLHPYDENHIIGIGYNVKSNGSGGVTNETVKISMFDVSDLNSPKEIFSKTLGKGYSYSDITYNHKLLMYDKQRNLMGFPISMRGKNGRIENSIILLNIDLENKEFKLHSQYILENYNYYMRKVIYIEDTVYILCDTKILAFDMNTLENIASLDLPADREDYYKGYIMEEDVTTKVIE